MQTRFKQNFAGAWGNSPASVGHLLSLHTINRTRNFPGSIVMYSCSPAPEYFKGLVKLLCSSEASETLVKSAHARRKALSLTVLERV